MAEHIGRRRSAVETKKVKPGDEWHFFDGELAFIKPDSLAFVALHDVTEWFAVQSVERMESLYPEPLAETQLRPAIEYRATPLQRWQALRDAHAKLFGDDYDDAYNSIIGAIKGVEARINQNFDAHLSDKRREEILFSLFQDGLTQRRDEIMSTHWKSDVPRQSRHRDREPKANK